jgi:hypothetical protein
MASENLSPLAGVRGDATIAAAGALSAAPQSPQNLSSGWLVAPHFGQAMTSDAPQAAQNLRPSRLSLPHCEQCIFPLGE